jgi:hypothetical protein
MSVHFDGSSFVPFASAPALGARWMRIFLFFVVFIVWRFPLKDAGFTKSSSKAATNLSLHRRQLGWFSAISLLRTDLTGRLPISKGNPEI